MIRKICVLICLCLALITLTLAMLSYRQELVFTGQQQGIVRWNATTDFEKQSDFLNLQTSPRTSLLRGNLQYLWVSKGQTNTSVRSVNAGFFLWQQTSLVLLGQGTTRMLNLYAGLLTNQLTVPLWGPLSLLLIYPTLAFVRGPVRRHRRRKRGLCLTCGYNLTGNTSGVCPECGRR